MKRFMLAAITAAVAAGWAGTAAAQTNLNTGAGSNAYANELVTPALPIVGVATVNTLGFGVSATQTRYVRYDLTNGKFQAAVAPAALVLNPAANNTVISQGGAANDTFVIFQVTAAGAGNAQTDAVTFTPGNLLVTDKTGSLVVTYRLYETAANAAAGGATGLLNTASAPVATFPSGLAFSAVTNTTTVDVAKDYKQFLNGVSATVAKIGTVTYAPNEAVRNPANGNLLVPADMPLFTAAGTKLVLTGADLTSAKENNPPAAATPGLWLAAPGNNCGVAAGQLFGTGRTATSVDFVIGANAVGTNPVPPGLVTGQDICFEANGTSQIAAQDFTVGTTVVAAAGSTTGNQAPIAAGSFRRNGTVLKAAFAESTTAAGVSTAVSLTNASAAAVPYTVTCVLNNGTVAGTPGTVAAKSATRLGLTNSLGCPSNGTLRGIVITAATVPGNLIGSIVRQNTSTGQASFDGMTGNQ